jgi:UDP-N-acetylglucosamine 3-dehydrogenase
MVLKKIPAGQPIRLVFLGCGAVTAKHSKLLKNFNEVELSFASRSEEKAKQYVKKFNGSRHFGSYEEAIHSPGTDVVFIATPPGSHLALALQAIEAGKHVIVEKPPFLNSTDFDLVAAGRVKTGVQVMVAENYFYKPLRRKLHELVQSDLIGEIKFLLFNATKTQKTTGWRDEKELAGGGALFEGGIHWINFISNLGLRVESAAGFQPTRPKNGEGKLERSMQVVVKYAEGPVGTLLYSWEINALINGLRLSGIYGTQGSITFESNGVFIFVRGKKWRFVLPGFADIGGFRGMFRDFFRALRSGEEPAFNLDLAKRDLEIIEAACSNAI